MKKIQITIFPIFIEVTQSAVELCNGKIIDYDDKMVTIEFNNFIDLYHFGRTEKMEEMFLNK